MGVGGSRMGIKKEKNLNNGQRKKKKCPLGDSCQAVSVVLCLSVCLSFLPLSVCHTPVSHLCFPRLRGRVSPAFPSSFLSLHIYIHPSLER